MKFKYFRDPENFAFRVDNNSKCSICGAVGLWFDAGGFYGENEIDCICDNCLADGKLKELGVETNEAFEGSDEEQETIIYRTPALPTWQGRVWPFINGQYCVFERMASKADFVDKDEFKVSFSDFDKENSDTDWLWEILPEKRIANHKEGNFNVSVYLFTCLLVYLQQQEILHMGCELKLITNGSNRSLRSLGRVKAHPLTKR